MIVEQFVPNGDVIYGWIEQVFSQGVRRPGYAADRWAEDWIEEQFRTFGLEHVRREPVELSQWEPGEASLELGPGGQEMTVSGFPLPHTASTTGLDANLVAFDPAAADRVHGAIALYDVSLLRVPHHWYVSGATWTFDPAGTFAQSTQILPFGREFQEVMGPAVEAGAAGFVGVLRDYPGDSRDYYVPYDAVSRPVPAMWVRSSDGERLRLLLADGAIPARLTVEAQDKAITSYNIVGELPGADDEVVIIGSHHDGPWSSAVEDGSGIALVLAQAAYWSRVPQAQRPHRLVFLLNAGHMAGGAGAAAFCKAHRDELDRVVLEVHLEHTANEFTDGSGELRPTGHPEARWWFTSRLNRLEGAVRAAIEGEDLTRSLMLRPDIFGPRPTTDGSEFYVCGVPIVNYLTAPFYLFDSMDTLDKIHRPSLVPVTRATIRIVESTAGLSAAAMRSDGVNA
jgi:hypothetical protein